MKAILFLILMPFAPPLNKGTFTGSVDMSNYWCNYYSNCTQFSTLNISFSGTVLGGRAYVKVAANGINDINISGASVIRGVVNNSPWAAGNYEVFFENTSNGISVNVLKY